MSQDRLDELAILPIENEGAKSLNMSKIIDDFAPKKRKKKGTFQLKISKLLRTLCETIYSSNLQKVS